tara:strand:+ start:1543 stop:2451 length:909 start_codon:yes stop_codon:yes gene_type:complete
MFHKKKNFFRGSRHDNNLTDTIYNYKKLTNRVPRGICINCNEGNGFFSCNTVKLEKIIDIINKFSHLPSQIDITNEFLLYQKNNKPITYDFFEEPDKNKIKYMKVPIVSNSIKCHETGLHYWNYNYTNFRIISPIVNKYYKPNQRIMDIYNNLIKKYNIDPKNTVALYYRGCDKYKETGRENFNTIFNTLLKIINSNKNINILLQTDDGEFYDFIKSKKLQNLIFIKENKVNYLLEGIHYTNNKEENYNDISLLLPILLIMSTCKYVLYTSSNVSWWIIAYRSTTFNTVQFLNGEIYNNIKN